ncbi:MAG: hypothetical protein WC393_00390 [Candidatus Nanoarchaeia archaeon]|jgi:hypothetical protein
MKYSLILLFGIILMSGCTSDNNSFQVFRSFQLNDFEICKSYENDIALGCNSKFDIYDKILYAHISWTDGDPNKEFTLKLLLNNNIIKTKILNLTYSSGYYHSPIYDYYGPGNYTLQIYYNNEIINFVNFEVNNINFIKNDYDEISYNNLMRYEEDYKNDLLYFRGKIIQVSEIANSIYQLRVNTKLSNYAYMENTYTDDTIYVFYHGNRLLEDDIIDIYGIYDGIYSYKAILGNTVSIPSIISVQTDLIQEAE